MAAVHGAMRRWVAGLILAAATLLATVPTAYAAELLMFEEQGCPWCKRWHAEVGAGYPKTPEGRRAPLRQLDLMKPRPVGIKLAAPVAYSPTFVLVENGREIGRITGYPGADFFWGLLGELLAKLDKGAAAPTAKTTTASRGFDGLASAEAWAHL
jgi:hypothetical protein